MEDPEMKPRVIKIFVVAFALGLVLRAIVGISIWTVLFFATLGVVITVIWHYLPKPRILPIFLTIMVVILGAVFLIRTDFPVLYNSLPEIKTLLAIEVASRLNTGNAGSKTVLYEYQDRIEHKTAQLVAACLAGDNPDSLDYALGKVRESTASRNKIYSAFDNDLSSNRKPLLGNRDRSSHASRQTVVAFEKSYDMKDAYDEYGQIRTFQAGKDDVRKDDKLEIIAKLKNGEEFSGQEIGIWRGKEFNPKWAETVNGYYNKKIEELTDGGFFVISLAKRDDVVVTV
ncbi:MAG: hypothetical protein PHU57_03775, partial [Patescibacteria group bacterium]|nr:hypothetical protein [Patescibacteria group bacterium]